MRGVRGVLAGVIFALPAALSAQGTGTIIGVVRDSLGAAIAGVEVTVAGTELRASTSASGGYRLSGVTAGVALVQARRLGFRPATREATVESGGTVTIDLLLVPLPRRIQPVIVRERRDPSDARLAGFYERRAKRQGYFLSRDDIARRGTTSFTDLLRDIPGVRVTTLGGMTKVVRIRGASCPPLVFIDGFPATAAAFDLESIAPSSVEGVELYSSSSTVPPVFVGPRDLYRCGVVAVWSRAAESRERVTAAQPPPVDLGRLLATEVVFTESQVDTAATPIDEIVPAYPDSLWRSGVAGRVVVEFVVDAEGNAEMHTFGIVSSTHPLFATAVRQAVAEAQFRPAIARNRAVRQVVQLPFEFIPESVPSRTPGTGSPPARERDGCRW